MKRIVFFILFGIMTGSFLGIVSAFVYPEFQSFENRRAGVLGDMQDLINEQVEEGNYRCCIEPACTMCFMGGWIWDDGICRCDDMIAAGEDDKVCPQCKKGLKEGICKSAGEKS